MHTYTFSVKAEGGGQSLNSQTAIYSYIIYIYFLQIELVNATTTPPADDSFAMENDTGSASPSDIDISIIDRLTKEESQNNLQSIDEMI